MKLETGIIVADSYTKSEIANAVDTLAKEISGFATYSKSGNWKKWSHDCVFVATRVGTPWEGDRIPCGEVSKLIQNWLYEVVYLLLVGDGTDGADSTQKDRTFCMVVEVADNCLGEGLEIRIRESKHESDDFVLTFAPVDEYSRIMKPETEMLKIKEALGRNANNESAADQAGEFVYDEMPHKEGM